MKNVDTLIFTYSLIVFSTVFILSLLSEERIDVYAALFAVEFFIASELTSPFSQAENRRKTIMEMILLAVFIGIVAERVLEVLM